MPKYKLTTFINKRKTHLSDLFISKLLFPIVDVASMTSSLCNWNKLIWFCLDTFKPQANG